MTEEDFIPNIPHDSVAAFGSDGAPTPYERNDFWEKCRPWLVSEGLELYELRLPKGTRPNDLRPKKWRAPMTPAAPADLPFAVSAHILNTAPKDFNTMDRLAPARDEHGQDLMLKLVDKGSYEYHIFEKLLACPVYLDNSAFPCVLPPTRILQTPHCYVIVAMPMWGNPIYIEDLSSVKKVLRFVECMLQGLMFLHDHRIAHRDICNYNMVVNHYRIDQDKALLREDLRQHRASDHVFYALMDFDQSIRLPQDCSPRQCWRPASESGVGAMIYKPNDTASGQPAYNPFAFDVAMLGNVFRFHFSEVVVLVPSLAALFDRMTTPVISQRFTAKEALQFFRDTTGQLDRTTLQDQVTLKPGFAAMQDANVYWSKLTPDSLAVFGRHRTPPPSWWSRVLAWVLSYPTGYRIIVSIRHILNV